MWLVAFILDSTALESSVFSQLCEGKEHISRPYLQHLAQWLPLGSITFTWMNGVDTGSDGMDTV